MMKVILPFLYQPISNQNVKLMRKPTVFGFLPLAPFAFFYAFRETDLKNPYIFSKT